MLPGSRRLGIVFNLMRSTVLVSGPISQITIWEYDHSYTTTPTSEEGKGKNDNIKNPVSLSDTLCPDASTVLCRRQGKDNCTVCGGAQCELHRSTAGRGPDMYHTVTLNLSQGSWYQEDKGKEEEKGTLISNTSYRRLVRHKNRLL